jgi:dTDP-4-dehydrorhamnose reductase
MGATIGQLGSDLNAQLVHSNHTVIGLDHSDIEITDIDYVNNVIKQLNPDLIINTAAVHQLEKCELNPILSFNVNGIGAKNLVIIANEYYSILYHISTDYVFVG